MFCDNSQTISQRSLPPYMSRRAATLPAIRFSQVQCSQWLNLRSNSFKTHGLLFPTSVVAVRAPRGSESLFVSPLALPPPHLQLFKTFPHIVRA